MPFMGPKGEWDLFVLYSPRVLFNQNFQKLSPNVADLIQTITSTGGGGGKGKKKKKQKKRVKARLAHIQGDANFDIHIIYK